MLFTTTRFRTTRALIRYLAAGIKPGRLKSAVTDSNPCTFHTRIVPQGLLLASGKHTGAYIQCLQQVVRQRLISQSQFPFQFLCVMVRYLLTAVGLTPGRSSTVTHLHKNYTQNTTKHNTQNGTHIITHNLQNYTEAYKTYNHIHNDHHHHKHQVLDPLIRSVSRVKTTRANASSVFQLFFFLVVRSGMISKGFAFVAFFANVETSSVCIHLSCPVCL